MKCLLFMTCFTHQIKSSCLFDGFTKMQQDVKMSCKDSVSEHSDELIFFSSVDQAVTKSQLPMKLWRR